MFLSLSHVAYSSVLAFTSCLRRALLSTRGKSFGPSQFSSEHESSPGQICIWLSRVPWICQSFSKLLFTKASHQPFLPNFSVLFICTKYHLFPRQQQLIHLPWTVFDKCTLGSHLGSQALTVPELGTHPLSEPLRELPDKLKQPQFFENKVCSALFGTWHLD